MTDQQPQPRPEQQVLSEEHLLARIEQEVERYRRYSRPFGLALFVIGGIEPSDAAAQKVGKVLIESIRYSDVIGHCEGYRLAVLMPGQSQSSAASAAGRLCEAIEHKHVKLDDHKITLRAGVASFEEQDDIDVQRLIAQAEEALESGGSE